MKVKIFLETAGNFEEREILLKFYKGVHKMFYGDRKAEQDPFSDTGVFLDIGNRYSPCDVAVMLGSWKARDRAHHEVRSSIVEGAHCFIVIETPLLGRVMFQKSKQHRIGVNGFLNNQGLFSPSNCQPDRLEKLGIKWDGWQNNKEGHIVLLLQLPGDASLRNIDLYDWARFVIAKIRQYTDKEILVRSHPGHQPKDADGYHKFLSDVVLTNKNVKFSVGRNTALSEDLKNAYCTVSYSSGSGIDSILHGIPTIATDPGNFAFDVSSNFIEDINDPRLAADSEIHKWLTKLSYSQWSPEEMAEGLPWAHLLPMINNVIANAPKRKK
jgi:hypothetical protein